MIPCRAGRRSTWIPLRACRSLSWWIALERSAATGCVRCALRSKLPSTALGERPPMPGTRRLGAGLTVHPSLWQPTAGTPRSSWPIPPHCLAGLCRWRLREGHAGVVAAAGLQRASERLGDCVVRPTVGCARPRRCRRGPSPPLERRGSSCRVDRRRPDRWGGVCRHRGCAMDRRPDAVAGVERLRRCGGRVHGDRGSRCTASPCTEDLDADEPPLRRGSFATVPAVPAGTVLALGLKPGQAERPSKMESGPTRNDPPR